jgi:hypothetical protein
MPTRFLAAVTAAVALALPAAAQAPDKGPALTFQAQPLGKLLDDAKAVARAVGGDEAVTAMDDELKEALGEKGFAGVDLLRPIVGYTELTETADGSGAVVVVPVTGEKDFLDFLGRMKLDVSAPKDGLYTLTPRDDAGVKNPPSRLRFKDNWAYLGANVPDDALAPARLVPAAGLLRPDETAAFAYRVHLGRIPAGLRKQAFEAVDEAVDQLKMLAGGDPAADAAKTAADALAKLVKRVGDQALTDGDVATARVRLDAATAEVALEAALTGKPGSKLAADIAARKPTVNRFGALVAADAAAGFKLQLPLFAPEVRDAVVALLEVAQKGAGDEAPPPAKPLAEEVLKGLIRTVKGGEFDLAAGLTGPDADGLFTAAVGLSFDDPSGVEKAVKELVKALPEEVQKQVQFDTAKVGGVSVHTADVGPFLPPELRPVFGEKAVVAVAFAPKGVYLGVGPAAVAAVTAGLKAEPAAAKALDVVVNTKRLHKLVGAIDPPAGERFGQAIQTDDRAISAVSLAIEGGAELRVRMALNLKLFPRWFAASAAGAGAVKP